MEGVQFSCMNLRGASHVGWGVNMISTLQGLMLAEYKGRPHSEGNCSDCMWPLEHGGHSYNHKNEQQNKN